jgi:hypothetical protein
MGSAVYRENVSENYGVGILYNLNSVGNVFKEGLTQNFVPMKFIELLAETVEGLLFNKIVAIHISYFLFTNIST